MNMMLEDLAVCAYALCDNDFSSIQDFTDCIPEALYVLHNLADFMGTKIRFSTVTALIDYVIEFNKLREHEVEQILTSLKKLSQGADMVQTLRSLIKTLLKRDIDVKLNEQDLAEIAIAALYASFIKITSEPQDELQILETPSLTPTVTTTIT